MNDYLINRWGCNYFHINEKGHVSIKPDRKSLAGDLFELTQTLVAQGIEPPILIRFDGIVRDRIHLLSEAFSKAQHHFAYKGSHKMVFPIKVNPQRHVIETVQKAGQPYGMGLEVGSKPELIAILAIEEVPGTLLLCNGYKDAEYISMALVASKLGRQTIIIIEQPYELKLVLDTAAKLGIEPVIGFRMKLSSPSAGRWKSSGGEHSKFGLFAHEILEGIHILKEWNKLESVKLLHFHLGSQIPTIESIKKALNEATRMYTELATLLPSLSYFDVGGGLAVDYEGTKNSADSSMNYTIDEYARDVVSFIGEACKEANLPEPTIITECGRAIVAHHALLITEVLDVTTPGSIKESPSAIEHPHLKSLKEWEEQLTTDNCREIFHDLLEMKSSILEGFIQGALSIQERAAIEVGIGNLLQKMEFLPLSFEEKQELDELLLNTYFCNFSVFQSLPDSWAIQQLFPVLPIHRLHETPTHRAILADLSCDSDGKINLFIGKQGPEQSLMLHTYTGEPYYIGIFLVGAYQEILGGLHNLFGDTNVVHAELTKEGKWEFSRLVEGDTIEEVLHYVQFHTENLFTQLHERLEEAIKANRITLQESAQIKKMFKQSLESYTYLVV